MGVGLPADYLRIPLTYNMAWDVCDKWIKDGGGEEVCAHYRGEQITRAALYDLSNRVANGLLRLGVSANTKFIIRSHNSPEYIASLVAGLKIGAVPVPISTLFRPRELEFVINNSESVAVITSQDYMEPLKEVLPRCPRFKHCVFVGDAPHWGVRFVDMIKEDTEVAPAKTSPNDHAFMLYTSGTTGEPKGVAHAHRWLIGTGDPVGKIMMRLKPDDVVLHPQEFSFAYPLGSVMYSLREGSKFVIYPGRAMPEAIFELIEKHRVTVLCSVPTMYRMLLAIKDAEKRYDLSSLKRCISAGETLPAPTYGEWQARIGCQILDGLGQSEIHIFVAEHQLMNVKPGSCGKPLPGYDVRTLDDEGKECGVGKVGQIAIREDNPGLFFAYYKNPEKWVSVHKDGWYLTGDMGYTDEKGYFWYLGRFDDMIKSRGYLISPKEVEETILEHGAVLEAGVVGIPDEMMGSRVKAFVVLKAGFKPTERLRDQIAEHVRNRIAPYKSPKEIEFTDQLPKTSTGKILRRALRSTAVTTRAS